MRCQPPGRQDWKSVKGGLTNIASKITGSDRLEAEKALGNFERTPNESTHESNMRYIESIEQVRYSTNCFVIKVPGVVKGTMLSSHSLKNQMAYLIGQGDFIF